MKFSTELAGAVLAVGMVAGCTTAAPMRFHSLLASEPARAAAPVAAAQPLVVTLAGVRVPAQVDQPQWLVRLPDGTLQLLEQDRWAGPLRDELHAALLEALALRWGVVDSRTAGAAAPVWRVVVDLGRFESVPGTEARIDGRWSIASGAPGAATFACAVTIRETVEADMPALARGHQRAVVRLADSIGAQLHALRRGQTPRCADPTP